MPRVFDRETRSRITQYGGWRIFMRGAESELSLKLLGEEIDLNADHTELILAHAFVLAKHGRTEAARRTVDTIKSVLREQPENTAAQFDLVLVDAHVRAYEDRVSTDKDAERLQRTLNALDDSDHIGQALALNQLCIYNLHMGHFDQAQENAVSAIRFYRKGGAEFGSLHLHAHLGQIKLMRGDITGAEALYRELERRVSQLPDDSKGLLAVARALRSEVAYEMNELSRSEAHLADAIWSVEENDAWLDILATAYRIRCRLAYVNLGLPGALTELSHSENVAKTRRMPRLFRLIQIERIRALTLSNEIDAAWRIMQTIGLDAKRYDWEGDEDWAVRQGTTAVTIARWLVRARRAPEALGFLEQAEDFAIRGGQLLSLAKLRAIRAAALWRLNRKSDATGALLSALRLLGRQPFKRFILDEGHDVLQVVRAILNGDHVNVPPSPNQRRRLSDLSYQWMMDIGGDSGQNQEDREDHTTHANFARKYLEMLRLGLTNKEISRIMGVSVNTVKYHLKKIYRDLRVDNRTRAVAEAQRLRIILENPPNKNVDDYPIR